MAVGGGVVAVYDEDPEAAQQVVSVLRDRGYAAISYDSYEGLTEQIGRPIGLHLLAIAQQAETGLRVLRQLGDSGTPAVVLVQERDFDAVREVTRIGAFDILPKPVDLDTMLDKVRSLLGDPAETLPEGVTIYEPKPAPSYCGMVGDHPSILRIFELIEKIATDDSTVILLGESGTGKELVARGLHAQGPRCDKPFIPCNCAAIPHDLLESELFGHERGAFTGASSTRIGRFELAHRGTLLLDEIAEMPIALQAKLLRALQGNEFERVGGTRTIKVDVRVIASSNRDLEKAVASKQFREDLYYRLNVIPISLPSLRMRRSDIATLAQHFLHTFNERKGRSLRGIASTAIEVLWSYSWPGNVRELENLVERLVVLKGEGVITPEDLPEKLARGQGAGLSPEISLPDEGLDLKRFLEEVEKELILQALHRSHGVKNQAAKLLGLNRTTLVEKIKKLRVNPHS